MAGDENIDTFQAAHDYLRTQYSFVLRLTSAMIRRLQLWNFKAFEKISVTFGDDALIVGPNNAGKSTVISAIRACSEMLRYASNKRLNVARQDGQRWVRGYAIGRGQFSLVEENLRHEFRNVETRVELTFSSESTICAVWPTEAPADESDESAGPYFYVSVKDRAQPSSPREVRSAFPSLGIIPILSPAEHDEPVGDDDYIRRNLDGRLASRHFRRQLYLLKREYGTTHTNRLDEFLEFSEEWVPEIRITELRTRSTPDGQELDLFYKEPGKRTEKEIFWAGDGIQVWLQLLLHIFRLRDSETIVFDEPDLYLHADLQRRLVRLLESLPAQTITATHSPEMLIEAAPEAVVWIDKSRTRAIRGPDAVILAEIASAIGSNFNLRLAKALRSTVVLFVEGKDMKIVRMLARTVGATRLAREAGIAVIPLEGFTNWEHIEPFEWMVNNLLQRSVRTFVVLDRDYRSDDAVKAVRQRLAALSIRAHVWHRKELESYLLEVSAIARLTHAGSDWVENALSDIADSMKISVFARALDEALRHEVSRSQHRVTATERFQAVFDRAWSDPEARLSMCPAKDVLRALNRKLGREDLGQVSVRAIAKSIRSAEIAGEMRDLLLEVEAALDPDSEGS